MGDYSFLRPFLCFNKYDFISLHILLSAFKNCQKISINGGCGKKLVFCSCIVEYIYDYLKNANSKSTKLEQIVICNVDDSGCSFKKIKNIFQDKFLNDSSSLMFYKYS